jgi:tol-pal system protein YbgF
MIRRNSLTTLGMTSFLAASLLMLGGCIKTRKEIRGETDNPDSGYEAKVTDVASENQKVSDELRGEINQLNGRIDDLQKKNEALAQDASKRAEREAQIRDMETKIQELQASQAAMIEALQKKEKEREKEKEVPKADPSQSFESAKDKFRKKDYDGALEDLNQYLKFPKGKHTEEALFYRGETLFAKEQYKKAILDYSGLQEKYPRSKHIPKSLLKIGMAFEALGMRSDAKAFYQELVDKHPKAPETKSAKAKLKE